MCLTSSKNISYPRFPLKHGQMTALKYELFHKMSAFFDLPRSFLPLRRTHFLLQAEIACLHSDKNTLSISINLSEEICE
ncbi:Uncharacterised protein [Klebsiella variicola]|nr:Uncharacterised protein [Klebsiella variicola]VAR93201.1 Uncharacterised protein [Klebsiella variicola]